MWQEEKFIFKLMSDDSHYLVFLSLGLIINNMLILKQNSKNPFSLPHVELSLILVVAFLMSLGLGFTGFLLSAAVFNSLVLAWRSPINAVSTILILFTCRPWEVLPAEPWWLQLPRWCILIWLLSWLRRSTSSTADHGKIPQISKGFILILMMAFWALITTVLSRDPLASLQFYFETFFRALVLVLIISLTARERKDVLLLSNAFAVGVVCLSIFSLWHFKGYDQNLQIPLFERGENLNSRRLEAVGSLGNSNDIAAVVMIPLGLLWPAILKKSTRIHIRLSATAIQSLLITTIMASQSRGALIATVAQAGIYFISQSQRPARMAFVVVAVVSFVAPFASHMMGRNSDDLDASTESRMNYYVTGLRMAFYSPLWGQGFGRYPHEFERFSPATLHEWGLRTAHSSWILVLAETGVIGLILFAAIHVRMFQVCWQKRRELPGLLLSLAGYSITILFLSHSWLMFPWILFALIEAGKITLEQEEDHDRKFNTRN